MATRTLRSVRLRNLLYASTGGKCAICWCDLPVGWHADHIEPWAFTGQTNVHGMQPLCPPCNLRKGTNVSVKPRPFQRAMMSEAIRLASAGERLLVGNVHAGSGKTKGYMLASNELWRLGYGARLAIFVPRLNLAIQAETDWDELRRSMVGPTFGRIAQRDNELPFLRENEAGELAFGYATTYQSLLANAQAHIDFVREAPTIVVFDEAQQLGAPDEVGGHGTRSGAVCEQLHSHSAFTFLLSGTPKRLDGRPLILAPYGEPEANGFRALHAHVNADYIAGVEGGYLREFEAILHDGRGIWQYLGEDPQTLVLSDLTRRVSHVLRQQGYWEPMVDRFLRKLRDVRAEIHPDLTGLIAAIDQRQADEIVAYLRRAAPELRVVLAVSNERLAKDNLRRFRDQERPDGDILVTVAMAHVGFDCPTISVILPLTATRSEPWLRQLFARGLRIWRGIGKSGKPAPEPDLQVCYVIAPDDKLMAEVVEQLRAESRAGVASRDAKTGGNPNGGGGGQLKIGWGLGAELLDDRVMGFNPEGDAEHDYLTWVRDLANKHGLARSTPESRLAAMLREAGGRTSAPVTGPAVAERPPIRADARSEKEREKELRSQCQRLAKRCDAFMKEHVAGWEYGHTHAEAKRNFGKSLGQCGLGELRKRLDWYLSFFERCQAEYGGE